MSKNLRKTIKYQGEKLGDLNIWKAVYSVLRTWRLNAEECHFSWINVRIIQSKEKPSIPLT